MSILCKLFGHLPNYGYGDTPGEGYFTIAGLASDGIGRIHAFLKATCERCGREYPVGRVHLPSVDYPSLTRNAARRY